MPMHIAFGGIHIESSTFNPVPATAPDFRVLRGSDLLHSALFREALDGISAKWTPLIHCRAVPGGPVARETYESFKAEFLERLASAGPIDGVYLAMHGAMFVEGMEDAEGDWIAAVRELVGPELPIAASYDLHGNLSQHIVDAIDLFAAYRTAPHIDVPETMRRAAAMLERAIRKQARPFVAWAPIPVLLPGERTSTVDEPARSLYRQLDALDRIEGIWDASLLVGYVWADEPRATAAAVMTGTNRAVIEKAAGDLARAYWNAREQFVFGAATGTIEECLDLISRSTTHPLVLADSGDNPTGGGVGDRPDVLRRILQRANIDALFAGITDPAATAAAHEIGLGGRGAFRIGSALDPSSGPPVESHAEVAALSQDDIGLEALLRIGRVHVVVSDRRRPYHDLSDFRRLGIDPHAEKVIVVKSGYLSPELAAMANPGLMALSPGVVDQDITRAPRQRMTRPLFPFDQNFAWTPRVFASKRAE